MGGLPPLSGTTVSSGTTSPPLPVDSGSPQPLINFPDIMRVANPSRTALATYNGSDYGTLIALQLDPLGLSETQITFSTSTFARSSDLSFSTTLTGSPPILGNPTNFQYMLNDISQIIQTNDSGLILNAGDNTAFSLNFAAFSPAAAVIDQLYLHFAIALNVSAYTSGNFNLNAINVSLKSYAGSGQIDATSPGNSITITAQTAFSNLTATGTLILIVKAVLNNVNFRVNQGQPFTVSISASETTGTGTRQIGLVPLFPYLTTNVAKPFYKSEILAHVKSLPDSIDKIVPYSTLKISGVNS